MLLACLQALYLSSRVFAKLIVIVEQIKPFFPDKLCIL